MASAEAQRFDNLDDFLTYHSPELKGALWIHDEVNLEETMPFHGYNYLFDGMLQKNEFTETNKHSLFVGSQFSHPFLLGVIKEGSSNMTNFISQFDQTLKGKVEKNDRVLILTKLGKAVPAEAKKKLKEYKLQHVTYTL